jgi:hypothetical protein
MRDYDITASGKVFTIPYRSTNKETSLVLHGNDSTNYGQALLNNLVRLTDNFCDTKPPANPILGQTYYNYNTKKLSVYKKDGWSEINLIPNTDYLDVVYLDETSKGPHGSNILTDVLSNYIPLTGNDTPVSVMTMKTAFDIPNEAVSKGYVDEIFREKSTIKYLPLAADTATMTGALRVKTPLRKADSNSAVTVGYVKELGTLDIVNTPVIEEDYNFVVTTYNVSGRLDDYKQPDASETFTTIYFSALLKNNTLKMSLPVTFTTSANMKSGYSMTVVCKSVDVNEPVYASIDDATHVTIRKTSANELKVDGTIFGFSQPIVSVSRSIDTLDNINSDALISSRVAPVAPVAPVATIDCCCDKTVVTPTTTAVTTTTTGLPTTTTTSGPTTTTTSGPTTTTTTGKPTTTTTGPTTTTTTGLPTTTTTIPSLPETPGNPSPTINGIDLVFVVDYTSSMSGVIENIKTGINNIVDIINTKSNSNYQLGLVLFDEFKYPVVAKPTEWGYPQYMNNADFIALPESQKYTNANTAAGVKQVIFAMETLSPNNKDSFKTQLGKINKPKKSTAPYDAFDLGSGSGFPEPGDIALDKVLNNIAGEFRNNVAKIVVLITDAVAGGTDDKNATGDVTTVNNLAKLYYENNIRMILLTVDSSATTVTPAYNPSTSPDQSYVNMANTTGGSVLTPITSVSLLENAIRAIP